MGAKLYNPSDVLRYVQEVTNDAGYRSPYRKDYARLLHSPAFRRLQGKTQLFPGFESDFFRNRLTHSLEVAQIAKSVALRINRLEAFRADPIDLDLVEFAGIAHDLGHPPFGHNGEAALDARMKPYGGFEGNAQTLRILARLERKVFQGGPDSKTKGVGVSDAGIDHRAGLNLTARTLASILKYDKCIPVVRDSGEGLVKGYYHGDKGIVDWVRTSVGAPTHEMRKLKTVECQIMDLADDIAYSTYDLEDAFKAGFLTPLGLMALDEPFRAKVATTVTKALRASGQPHAVGAQDILEMLIELFETLSGEDPVVVYQMSLDIASNGYARTSFTSQLVGEAVEAIEVTHDPEFPLLSSVKLDEKALRRVETLKHLTYNAVILSPRLKVAEFRGFEIVTTIFDALVSGDGHLLLPGDYQELYSRFSSDSVARHRVVCDFIAGMTDAYAIEFYARLKSENARTIFKPF